MKLTALLAAGAISLTGLMAPEPADAALGGLVLPQTDVPQAVADNDSPVLADRGRGRGRGGDDNGRDDNGGDDRGSDDRGGRDRSNDDNGRSGSGRDKPRIPGGSGCDDAGDIAEHAECSG
jgi:hypothetical protein